MSPVVIADIDVLDVQGRSVFVFCMLDAMRAFLAVTGIADHAHGGMPRTVVVAPRQEDWVSLVECRGTLSST